RCPIEDSRGAHVGGNVKYRVRADATLLRASLLSQQIVTLGDLEAGFDLKLIYTGDGGQTQLGNAHLAWGMCGMRGRVGSDHNPEFTGLHGSETDCGRH